MLVIKAPPQASSNARASDSARIWLLFTMVVQKQSSTGIIRMPRDSEQLIATAVVGAGSSGGSSSKLLRLPEHAS